MKLESALIAAERREKSVACIVVSWCTAACLLTVVGASGVAGPFDPFSKDATFLSTVLGVIYLVAALVFPTSVLLYFTRFRPAVREAKERLRDASILEIQRQVREIRTLIAPALLPDQPGTDRPQSG